MIGWDQKWVDKRNREVLGAGNWEAQERTNVAQGFVGAVKAAEAFPGPPARSKYNSRKKEVDGHIFDSTAEARRYSLLKENQRLGFISALELQPRFLLQAGFRGEDGKWVRKVEYVADFRYTEVGEEIVEDVKGMATPLFSLKLKLFRAKYPKVKLYVLKGRQPA